MGNKSSALKLKKGKDGDFSKESKTKFINALRGIPLLGKLKDKDLLMLGDTFELKEFKPNARIIKQGDKGNGFYIIHAGKAKVTIKKGIDDQEVGELKTGDYLGERALLDGGGGVRAATVTAIAATTCLYWSKEAFYKLFTKSQLNIRFAKRVAISAENMGSAQSFSAPANAVRKKTSKQIDMIKEVMYANVLFRGLDEDHLKKVIDEMYLVEFKPGQVPIKQGDRGDRLYIVESGMFDIKVRDKDTKQEQIVTTRGSATLFGELALMYNAPRAATVVASKLSKTWVVDRFTFRRVLKNVSTKQLTRYRDFLRKVDLLAPLTELERGKIAEAIEEVNVAKGTMIVEQGKVGHCMYIIGRGEVYCEKSGKEVARYKRGDYFGERALLKAEADQKRGASVYAATNCKLLRLNRNAVMLLLGPVEEIMRGRVSGYDTKTTKTTATVPVKSSSVPLNLKEFKIIGTLGRGSFGHVRLVEGPDGSTYALKAVSKVQVVQTGQKGHIISEKRVMEKFDHPFLLKLFGYYHDSKCLYFLLETCLGGELFTVLRSKMFFEESIAKFYAATVTMAFEYMHSMDIIYRDLKPENLLLDSRGFLKVVDFGFAKEVHGRTHTLCGTPDYLAPEVITGKGHGKGVDWWTLGILIYEMLTGQTPFFDQDQMVMMEKITIGTIKFPSHTPRDAKSLVKKLLNSKPHKRLGVVKGGAKCIMAHDWFSDFDFKKLYAQKLKPPIVPAIKDEHDLSNFDDYGEEDEHIPTYTGPDDWSQDFSMK